MHQAFLRQNENDLQWDSDADERRRRLRQFLHNQLIESMEHEFGSSLPGIQEIRAILEELMQEMGLKLQLGTSDAGCQQLIEDVLADIGGFGPITQLMVHAGTTDILINGPYDIWAEQHGVLQKTDLRFDDEDHLRRLLDRLVGSQGRQLDARNPMVDTRLADGSRLHAIIPPLCDLGPVVSIRRFASTPPDMNVLLERDFLSSDMLSYLESSVAAGINIVIAGGAGAGKTSLLNALSNFIPDTERIVTVEETAELRLRHPHVIPLESRAKNSEGNGGISLRDLVRTALRMRADRILVGEVRGAEVLDMLQAMNVGHEGSITTLHANSPQDVILRLEALAMMGDSGLGIESVRQMIASSVQIIVQVMRFRDGSRRIVSISELQHDAANKSKRVCEMFAFQHHGFDENGELQGRHAYTGQTSELASLVEARGYSTDGMTNISGAGADVLA